MATLVVTACNEPRLKAGVSRSLSESRFGSSSRNDLDSRWHQDGTLLLVMCEPRR
jgi:hypothetical protein